MPCVCCGRDENLVGIKGKHIGNLMACTPCMAKYGGDNIAAEADRLIVKYFLGKPIDPVCAVCGDPVLMAPDGNIPMWCQKCEQKRLAFVNAQARR